MSPPRGQGDAALAPAMQRWLRRYPALRLAYEEAIERFGDASNVCGFGIGRPYQESADRYARRRPRFGGLAVIVYVRSKRDASKLSRGQRIPSSILVRPRGAKRGTRVPVDVVEAGPTAGLDTRRGLPTAGRLTPGRLLAVGTVPADAGQGSLGDDYRAGTAGAVVRSAGQTWVTSAGHVFLGCRPTEGPDHALRIGAGQGVDGDEWRRVVTARFRPSTIEVNGLVQDAMLFRAPAALLGEVQWPDAFDGKLATADDIDDAIVSTTATGYLWVERKGRVNHRARIPVDLRAPVSPLQQRIRCGGAMIRRNYSFVWHLAFDPGGAQSAGGDSGAPVFIHSASGDADRLLGFHFLRVKARRASYAVDARLFLGEVLGDDVEF